MIIPQFELARLHWYVRWSQGELSQIQSNVSAVISRQNEMSTRHPPTDHLSGLIEEHPTRSVNWDAWVSQQEKGLEYAENERIVRRALQLLTQDERQRLALAFVAPVMITRNGFGVYGNLADRTSAARLEYKRKKRYEMQDGKRVPIPMELWLNKINRRSRSASVRERAGQVATLVMIECEADATRVGRTYMTALKGVDPHGA